MLKFGAKICAGAVLSLALAACSATYRNHGFVPSQDELDQLVVGVDTRASVAELIGAPNSSGVTNDGGWYYIAAVVETKTYNAPKVIEREMVAISFDEEDQVENIERFSLEDGRVLVLTRRVTESPVKGPGFFRQLLGNLGNFDPTSVIGGG